MHNQQRRTLQIARTTLAPEEVLAAAKRFFARRNNIYAAFPDREGPTFVSMRGQGGEEVLIAAATRDGVTEVTGSSYLFDQQIARFFVTLPPSADEAEPELAGSAVDDATTPDEAPPAGAATGTGPAGGAGQVAGAAGGSAT